MALSPLRHVNVTRYITPLREGGSLPGLVEADDQFMYVLKFRGAGQGKKALIAELIGGELARVLGFNVPELVFATLDVAFGRIEGDEEIQDLLKASTGMNLGLHYLSGAVTYDPLVTKVDFQLASDIVWFDSLLLNVDRTVRNTNLLWWHKELWLIDHGAALYFHHTWSDWENPERPFPRIKDHVMLPLAVHLQEANERNKMKISDDTIREIVRLIPDDWLKEEPAFSSIEAHREAYAQFLITRLAHSEFFVNEAIHARESRF